MKITLIQDDLVVEINKRLCLAEGNPHHLLKPGGVSSALHSAYYPGDYPFVHGGIPGIAGALSFYLCQSHAFQDGNKRTAAQTSLLFLRLNGWDIRYPLKPNGLALIIEGCAKGEVDIEGLKKFYDSHKTPR